MLTHLEESFQTPFLVDACCFQVANTRTYKRCLPSGNSCLQPVKQQKLMVRNVLRELTLKEFSLSAQKVKQIRTLNLDFQNALPGRLTIFSSPHSNINIFSFASKLFLRKKLLHEMIYYSLNWSTLTQSHCVPFALSPKCCCHDDWKGEFNENPH